MTQYAEITIPKSIAVPAYEAIPTPLLKLRWRFDFTNKMMKRGVWNGASPHEADSAWRVDKTGLVRACIEGEFFSTQEEMILVDCQGQDFVSFEWEAYARCPGLGVVQMFSPKTTIAGLSLVSRTEKITVWRNGHWIRRPLRADELGFKNKKEHSV